MKTDSDTPETIFRKIKEIFPSLLIRDQARLGRRMRAFAHSKDTAALSSFLNYLQNLSAHSLHRFADSLTCEFPEELPISAKTEEISEALKQHQAVIVCGSTGSGAPDASDAPSRAGSRRPRWRGAWQVKPAASAGEKSATKSVSMTIPTVRRSSSS